MSRWEITQGTEVGPRIPLGEGEWCGGALGWATPDGQFPNVTKSPNPEVPESITVSGAGAAQANESIDREFEVIADERRVVLWIERELAQTVVGDLEVEDPRVGEQVAPDRERPVSEPQGVQLEPAGRGKAVAHLAKEALVGAV